MNFSKKNVLVTGGSRGIGKAVVQAFAKHGACVAFNYKSNRSLANEIIESLTDGNHLAIQADMSKPDSVKNFIESAISKYGKIDIVVNNAGLAIPNEINKLDYADWNEIWHQTFEVNLFGAANLIYLAAQHMMRNGGGRIINISSRGAFKGLPDNPAYAASKAALNSMSQSLAQKLAKYNIHIGVVAPGFVETDMSAPLLKGPKGKEIINEIPLGRVAKPDEVANVVLFLASEGTEYLTGAIIDVNGASYLR